MFEKVRSHIPLQLLQGKFRGATFKYWKTHVSASHTTFSDEQHVRERHWHIKPGDVVWDVGACFGSYTLPALALGGYVTAFCPSPTDRELLERNLKENGWGRDRCEVMPYGLHSKGGYWDQDKAILKFEQEVGLLPVVPVSTFGDTYSLIRLDWVKLDVEGAELEVLMDMKDILQQFKPKVLVECHLFHDEMMELKVTDFMRGLGLGYVFCSEYNKNVGHVFFET